ncbi:MAG: hypothetical protein V1846_02905 [Candidatus Komeilibacteria bacterium]
MFKNKFLIIGLILIVVLGIAIATITSLQNRVKIASIQPVTLEYWGVWEQPEDISLLTQAYHQRHPLITINYRTFTPAEYASELIKAWAQDKGPDIFMVPNTWIREYKKYSQPMPATMSVPVQYVQGTLKKETITRLQNYAGYNPKNIKDLFLDVVYHDVVDNNAIYGLPYSVDTMALFYNRSLLQANGLAEPAKTWQEIVQQAGKISKLNADNTFAQSTIALGGTTNIPNAFDIISLLMSQVGVTMGNDTSVSFAEDKKSLSALEFYSSFARPNTTVYSWNKDQASALDVFTSGRLAYFLGYTFHAPLIKRTNPNLDWDVVPVPQAEGATSQITYANYWVNAVAKKSKHAGFAWQAVYEMTQADNVKSFLSRTGRTTALRSLVSEQQKDPVIGPFAQNLLTAQSWYRGYNFPLAQEYFFAMINTIVTGGNPTQALQAAETKIQQTYQAPK